MEEEDELLLPQEDEEDEVLLLLLLLLLLLRPLEGEEEGLLLWWLPPRPWEAEEECLLLLWPLAQGEQDGVCEDPCLTVLCCCINTVYVNLARMAAGILILVWLRVTTACCINLDLPLGPPGDRRDLE